MISHFGVRKTPRLIRCPFYAAMSPCGLSRGNQRADFGNPRSLAIRLLHFYSAVSRKKSVSRRREKKKRLRRDDLVGYRGVTSGLTSGAREVSRYALLRFFPKTCRIEVRRSQGVPRKQAALKFGVSRKFSRIFTLCSLCPPCEHCFF